MLTKGYVKPMARHPAPTALALLKGADKQNPQRYRERKKAATAAAGIGDVPEYLTGGGAVVWLEVAPLMVEGVLTVADRVAWCALCELEAERREAPREFTGAKYATLVSLLARFGMTPSDRAKVSIADDSDKPANEFAEFGQTH